MQKWVVDVTGDPDVATRSFTNRKCKTLLHVIWPAICIKKIIKIQTMYHTIINFRSGLHKRRGKWTHCKLINGGYKPQRRQVKAITETRSVAHGANADMVSLIRTYFKLFFLYERTTYVLLTCTYVAIVSEFRILLVNKYDKKWQIH